MMILPDDASLQVVAARLAEAGNQPHAEIMRVLGVALARIAAMEEAVHRLLAAHPDVAAAVRQDDGDDDRFPED